MVMSSRSKKTICPLCLVRGLKGSKKGHVKTTTYYVLWNQPFKNMESLVGQVIIPLGGYQFYLFIPF